MGSALEVESGTNDPIAVFLTVILTQMIISGADGFDGLVLIRLVQQAGIGLGAGLSVGFAIVWLLNRVDMTSGLHPLFVVATAIFLYGLTSLLGAAGCWRSIWPGWWWRTGRAGLPLHCGLP